MGLNFTLSFWDAVLLQIGAIILLPLLPIFWIIITLIGLVRALLQPSHAKDAAKACIQPFILITTIPFGITLMNFISFSIWFVASIYKIVGKEPPAWAKARPSSSHSPKARPEEPGAHSRSSSRAPLLATHKKPYKYSTLEGEDHVRLLVIFPGSFNSPLRGQLVTTRLSGLRRPSYDALSYTWADETGDASLSREFRCYQDDSVIRITKNCEAAMRNLRHPKRQRRMWIDAICINQDNDTERNHQVSIMSKIYTLARCVVVYTGEGTAQTDTLFDWLNRLNPEDLDFPSNLEFDNVAEQVLTNVTRYWDIGRERLLRLVRNPGETPIMSELELISLVKEYFSRRWFRRVWVLQEVTLPDIRKITVTCGTKSTSAARALHALSLLHKDSSGSVVRIFVLLRKRKKGQTAPHLLDILVETRDREAQDPRDIIFGVLSMSNALDGKSFPKLEADYGMATREVYAHYSALFMQNHGPGFFLSLIKSPPTLTGLPSWSADWTSPWPNSKSLREKDFVACSRPANDKDGGAIFEKENGYHILTLVRPRILRGYFTKNGHLDGATAVTVIGVESLKEDEVLIEMYPGLATLLLQDEETGYYRFIQVCPHALSQSGVDDLVREWACIVTDAQSLNEHINQGPGHLSYLGPTETFKIR